MLVVELVIGGLVVGRRRERLHRLPDEEPAPVQLQEGEGQDQQQRQRGAERCGRVLRAAQLAEQIRPHAKGHRCGEPDAAHEQVREEEGDAQQKVGLGAAGRRLRKVLVPLGVEDVGEDEGDGGGL